MSLTHKGLGVMTKDIRPGMVFCSFSSNEMLMITGLCRTSIYGKADAEDVRYDISYFVTGPYGVREGVWPRMHHKYCPLSASYNVGPAWERLA